MKLTPISPGRIGLCLVLSLGLTHISQGATVNVSGGGTALRDAITAAASGDEIIVNDSLDYAPVVVGQPLFIHAAPGQTPRIVSDITYNGGMAVQISGAGINGAVWAGIDLIQNVVGGAGGHNVMGIYNDPGTVTVSNCTIQIDVPGGSVDARVMWIGANTHMVNVTLKRSDNNGNPLAFVGDGGGNSVFDNCVFGPTPFGSGITDIAAANGTLTLNNCTFTGIANGRGINAVDRPQTYNVNGCTFGTGSFAVFAGNAPSMPGTVFNFNGCKIGPSRDDWLIFAGDGEGGVLNFTNCVIFCNASREILMFTENKNNTFNFAHCTFTETQPGGGIRNSRALLFVGTSGNGTLGSYSFRNCLVNWPGSANTYVVRGSAAVSAGANLVYVGSSAGGDAFRGVGTEIVDNPQMLADGYHILGTSPAIDVGTAGIASVDIDGQSRPIGPAADLGTDETPKVMFSNVSGGGNALQAAIDAALDDYYIVVQDSLDYGPVVVNKRLTIMAALGQTPRVVSDPAVNSGIAVQVTVAGANGSWSGINAVKNLTGGVNGHHVFQTDASPYGISNAVFAIDTPGGTAGVQSRALGLGGVTTVYNVTASRNDNDGQALVRAYNTGSSSTLINCTFASANGLGLNNLGTPSLQTLTLKGCVFNVGGNGVINTYNSPQIWNVSDTTINGPCFAIYVNPGAAGSTYNVSRSKMGPAKNDWLIFAGDADNLTFNFTNSVVFCDSVREHLIQTENRNNNFNWVHCTFTETQPGGGPKNFRKLIFAGSTPNSSTFSFRNCLVNWPGSADVALVSASALASPPVGGINLIWAASTSGGDAFNGIGTRITANPLAQSDGYHLKGVSPAIDAAAPGMVSNDIDGTTRPLDSGYDLGAAETLKSLVLVISGGGNALQNAVTSAQSGYNIVIEDSQTYGPLIIDKNVVIEAAVGATPVIVANPAANGGRAVQATSAGLNATLKGFAIVQNAAGGDPGHNVFQLDSGGPGGTTFTLEDCSVMVNLPGGNLDARVVGLGNKAVFKNVTLSRNDNNGNPLVLLYDSSQNSSFLNCKFGPTVDANAISAVPAAGGTITISNCVFSGINPGRQAIACYDRPQTFNIQKTTFGPNVFAIYAGNGGAANGVVWNVNQSFFGPGPGAALVFAGDGNGAQLNFTNSVFFAGASGASQMINGNRSNTWNFVHCTMTETGPGGGPLNGRNFLNVGLSAAPGYGNGTNGLYNFQNCIFNWPGSSDVRLVGGAGLNIPAVTAGANLIWVGGLNAADSLIGVGTQILQDPKILSDGYHIASISPAAGAGVPGFADVDIAGNVRPATPPNPCLGATETPAGVLTHVTGGGGALQAAIDAAAPGDWLQVDDSLDYTPVSIGKNLTIVAGAGQNPRVLADIGVRGGNAVQVYDDGVLGSWIGIDVIQNVGGGGGGHNVFMVHNATKKTPYTIQDCSIAIDTSEFVDARVSFFGNPVHLVRVTFFRNDSTSYNNPLAWFGDSGNNSVVDECVFGPTPFVSVVITGSAVPNPGLIMNKSHVIGGANQLGLQATDSKQIVTLNRVTFNPYLFAFYVGNPGSSPGTKFNLNGCVMGPSPARGEGLVFAGDGNGAAISFTNTVFYADSVKGGALFFNGNKSNNWTFAHCTFTETQPGGAPRNGRMVLQAGGDSVYVVRNCIFNWPGSAGAQVIGGPSTIPVVAGVNLLWFADVNANDALRGAGTEIADDPQMSTDGYTIGPLSPAVDAGTPGVATVDLNGTARPLNTGYDLGAVEVFRPAYVAPTVLAVTPPNGTVGALQFVNVGATIRDGTVTPNPASFVLKLNGQSVVPSTSKTGTLTTVSYVQPGGLMGATVYSASLVFSDTSGTPNWFTNTWSFTTQAPMDTAAPRLQDSGPQGLLVLDAKHFNRNTPAGGSYWELITGVTTPTTTAMQALPIANRNVFANVSASPLMEYKATFVTNGTHYIWVLGEGDSGSGARQRDTVNIGLNGTLAPGGIGVGGNFEFLGGYVWNNGIGNTALATLEVAALGEQVVDVWMQKDGFAISMLVLTTDPNFDPNTVTAESPLNPAKPVLGIQKTVNGTVIQWSGGGVLQSAPAADGPWAVVTGASGSLNVNPTDPARFYRVVR